ncbi:hypothetical protein PB01_02760 [Psychrobacillus glaciei]|uniref:DUF4367 domain-containing protein n=1 Tax=Psychrobacillus glaciei TaxID=2283160 RepID=A0A5J6SIM3_9BACI|nr:hypothetical protein [Psychrobacillus glaciei]QFF97820.1 hypothetical protein PB01_02760 [Psychrobacillus glaciei]
MGNFIGESNRKVIFIFILFFISITGYYLFSSLAISSYKSLITIEQVPEVLRLENVPDLPTKWAVESVEKYDDGFISPLVTIKYKNEVILRLTTSHWDFSKDFAKKKQLNIGEKKVDYYFNEKEVAYVCNVANINYAIISPKHLQSEVKVFIENLN